MSDISFIHAADLHLDSPFKGLSHIPESIFQKVKESTFEALDLLVEQAIEKQVDFVLLVGDLFDHEKQSLKAQVHLRNAFEKLKHHYIYVYVSYGNHDFIRGNLHPVTYPDNVFIFPDESVNHFIYQKNGEMKAAIYGFSFENRAVTANKAAEYETIVGDIPYHIAMLHGSLHSNTEHDVYAPFHISDLTEKDFDYWALGHIHQREMIRHDPPVVYPGNIQGRNKKEAGEKGCYHVVLSGDAASMTFLPLQSIKFNQRSADISDCQELHQLESVISQTVTDGGNSMSPELLRLTLTGDQESLEKWEPSLDEVIQLVNETFIPRTGWKYIYQYSVEQTSPDNYDELAQGEHFIGELLRHIDDVSIQPYLSELYQHKQARKFLDPISGEREMRIKQKAKQLLVHQLFNGGE
ncbi:DNA repair exonuclease SbcCD nuclease subunit [Lentibacillus halodurans]|uniref:DNA repair exonuclease SbcCD nuclease subunit n=1 Tax=Lentibacillus halodurans TaxID=237679 RepID=A0A1I0VZD3_9BACI|nr:DNA repair exonuclease [Lentibacillus halodurans]SFA81290.1 DNA repair exonuclease SbcCD nuclease subunit [Lentibacillus halodurans]